DENPGGRGARPSQLTAEPAYVPPLVSLLHAQPSKRSALPARPRPTKNPCNAFERRRTADARALPRPARLHALWPRIHGFAVLGGLCVRRLRLGDGIRGNAAGAPLGSHRTKKSSADG